MRSHQSVLTVGLLSAVLGACGGRPVTVVVQASSPEGNLVPVADHPVTFLPFNRDSIFDALTARAAEPEPKPSDALAAMTQQVGDLQVKWRNVESQWANARDSLKDLSDRLQNMDRRSKEYRTLYDRFDALDSRVTQLDRENKTLFARFDSVQKIVLSRQDSLKAVREAWEDEAFKDYNAITDTLMKARGHQMIEDTTTANGMVTQRLKGGEWYVTTRLATPVDELYWNIKIEPSGPDTLRLTAENAKHRMRL